MEIVSRQAKAKVKAAPMALVYCPICTHSVDARVIVDRRVKVEPGQKCPRCSASLDAGVVIRFVRAA